MSVLLLSPALLSNALMTDLQLLGVRPVNKVRRVSILSLSRGASQCHDRICCVLLYAPNIPFIVRALRSNCQQGY